MNRNHTKGEEFYSIKTKVVQKYSSYSDYFNSILIRKSQGIILHTLEYLNQVLNFCVSVSCTEYTPWYLQPLTTFLNQKEVNPRQNSNSSVSQQSHKPYKL